MAMRDCSESIGRQYIAVIALILVVLLTGTAHAKEQVKNNTETLATLAVRQSVGKGVVQALGESRQVRVYIGMRGSKSNSGRRAGIIGLLPGGSFKLMREFSNFSGFAGMADAEAVEALSRHPDVWRVDLDEGGSGNALQALPLAKLDLVKSSGLGGKGITVAVIDSGIDTNHPDLVDSLVAEQCFCTGGGCCPNGQATQSGAGSAEDDHGHGTNVSGIISSNGVVAHEGGAPDVDIVAIKVLDSNNSFCCSSDIIAALDWIISDRADVNLINMSLGTNSRFQGNCDNATSWASDYAVAINTLRASGVAVIVSSGNDGSGVDMQAPACIANAISVGAVWDSNVGSKTQLGCTDATTSADQVTCFSNASTTTDLFAPGAPYTSSGRGGGTSTFYGTSQAAPTVTACAALLLEGIPGIQPPALEAALKSSQTLVTDATNGRSYPRLDCHAGLPSFIFENGFEQP